MNWILKLKKINWLYKNAKKWHTPSFIVFFSQNTQLKLAFITSKKVGNAVVRNKARRRVRALVNESEDRIISGDYIFVMKNEINEKSHLQLQKDFQFAFKRMNLYKNEKDI
jgi:ribonuclease P protein component